MPVGCQADRQRPVMIVTQGMTNAILFFLKACCHIAEGSGLPLQEPSIMLIERHHTSLLLFSAILRCVREVGMHTDPAHRT